MTCTLPRQLVIAHGCTGGWARWLPRCLQGMPRQHDTFGASSADGLVTMATLLHRIPTLRVQVRRCSLHHACWWNKAAVAPCRVCVVCSVYVCVSVWIHVSSMRATAVQEVPCRDAVPLPLTARWGRRSTSRAMCWRR